MPQTANKKFFGRAIIVVPCLDEVDFIEDLVTKLDVEAEHLGLRIIVVDGGSTDGSQNIVAKMVQNNPRLILLHNDKTIQSAGINLAVAEFGGDCNYLIRVDAHGHYPDDYCSVLLHEMDRTGADSIVVAMATEGVGVFQKATALAQNSKLGNGGAKHRKGAKGHWTDHGHHAAMRIEAFKQVGGYDESFTHNEDAELDCRLTAAGFRIWMTDQTHMVYFPRSSAWPLFQQYLGYGRGRAKNLLKHRMIPRARQAIPLMVLPVVAVSLLATINWYAVVPAVLWITFCFGYGVWLAVGEGNRYGPLASISAMIMHLAWSTGFWLQLLGLGGRQDVPS